MPLDYGFDVGPHARMPEPDALRRAGMSLRMQSATRSLVLPMVAFRRLVVALARVPTERRLTRGACAACY